LIDVLIGVLKHVAFKHSLQMMTSLTNFKEAICSSMTRNHPTVASK